MMEADAWAMEDLPAARDLVKTIEVKTIEGAEPFCIPAIGISSLTTACPDYDEGAAKLLKQRRGQP